MQLLRGEGNHAASDSLRAKRDYAMMAMPFGCGLRRSELVGLESDEVQTRRATGPLRT
jgi:site-specific recombinase XerC